MLVEVFGPGCARCKQTAKIMELALEQSGRTPGGDAMVQKIEDMRIAAMRGVLSTPAVAIDGRLVSQGKIPTVDEAKGWIGAAS
jgi:small redox-active disulfide protein 2